MAGDHFAWDQNSIDKLIELWSSKPVLYDPSCIDYRDKNKRDAVLADIASELGTIDSDVRDKMKTLRSQYSRERLHEEKSLADAAIIPGRVPYKSKWMYFMRLSFLDERRRRARREVDGDGSAEKLGRLPTAEYLQDSLQTATKCEALTDDYPGEGQADDADDFDDAEAELMIDSDGQAGAVHDTLAGCANTRLGNDKVEERWAAQNGGWHSTLTPAVGSNQARLRYSGGGIPSQRRPQLNRRRVTGPGRVAARGTIADRPPQRTYEAVAAPLPPTTTDDAVSCCENGATAGVDTLLRLVENAAARGAASRTRAQSEDDEAVFGRFIASLLRQISSGRERQLAKLRVHRALVSVLVSDDHAASGGRL